MLEQNNITKCDPIIIAVYLKYLKWKKANDEYGVARIPFLKSLRCIFIREKLGLLGAKDIMHQMTEFINEYRC